MIALAINLEQSLDQFLSNLFAVADSGGPSGDGLLLEAGTDFLLLETGDFILLE